MIRASVVVLAIAFAAVPRAEAGRHCKEISLQVGRSQCHRFGDWSLITRVPAITTTFAMRTRHLVLAPLDGGSTAIERGIDPPASDGSERSGTLGVAMGLAVGSRPFVGVELEMGGNARGLYAIAALPIGVRGRAGWWLLEAAAVPELRTVGLPSDLDRVIEARLTVHRLLSPWWSIAATAGADVVGGNAWITGLAIVGHVRAFDGL